MTMYELLTNEAFSWSIMAILIFALTFLFKFPYKKFVTSRIKDEKKRKLANKAIVIITLGLGIALNYLYCFWQGLAFTLVEFGEGLTHGFSAITLYSMLEIKTGGKVENPFNNEDSQEVIKEVEQLIDNTTTSDKKTKKKEKKPTTAEKKFWDLVGKDD